MALSTAARRSLENLRDYVESNGSLPTRSTVESDISRHYLEFGFLTEAEFRQELRKNLFIAMVKALLNGPFVLSASARESLQWCVTFIEAMGNLPERNLVDFEIAKHFSNFRLLDESTARRELGKSPFIATVKIILSIPQV